MRNSALNGTKAFQKIFVNFIFVLKLATRAPTYFKSPTLQNLIMVSISSTFYIQIFRTLHVRSKSFWNDVRTKNSYVKMLMKLTNGEKQREGGGEGNSEKQRNVKSLLKNWKDF